MDASNGDYSEMYHSRVGLPFAGFNCGEYLGWTSKINLESDLTPKPPKKDVLSVEFLQILEP